VCGTNQPATKMGKREILGVEDPQDFALFSAKKHLPFSYTLVSFSFSPLFPVLLSFLLKGSLICMSAVLF